MATRKINKKTGKPVNLLQTGGYNPSAPLLQPNYNMQSIGNQLPAMNAANMSAGQAKLPTQMPSGGAGGGIAGMGASMFTQTGNDIMGHAINDFVGALTMKDMSQKKGEIASHNATKIDTNTYDDLLEQYGTHRNIKNIKAKDLKNNGSDFLNIVGGAMKGSNAGSQMGPMGAIIGGVAGAANAGIAAILGGAKRKRESRKLNKKIKAANEFALRSYDNAASNIDTKSDWAQAASYYDYGGYLGNASDIRMLNSGGSIHIKKANRGKFTSSAQSAGMGVQEFARHVLANKEDYSTLQRKRANFARNAANWNACGGKLMADGGVMNGYGADFTNGFRTIGNGGTHEMNPNEGVQIGVDQEGTPNLVEEGESLYNDYVFSNRLSPTNSMLKSYGLKDIKSKKTFAELAQKLAKESSERPNDPISQNGLRASMQKLTQAQEEVKALKEQMENPTPNVFATGGPIRYDVDWQQSYNNSFPHLYYGQGMVGDVHGSTTQYGPGLTGIPMRVNNSGFMQNYNQENPVTNNPVDTPVINESISRSRNSRGIATTPVTNTPTRQTLVTSPADADPRTSDPYLHMTSDATIDPSTSPAMQGINTGVSNANSRSSVGGEWMRYAPVVGAGLGAITSLLSRPNYRNADSILNAAPNRDIQTSPIGNYLAYQPLDRNYYINQLQAMQAATRRGIENVSGGNRGAAMAGMIAADNNANMQFGALARQAEEYNRQHQMQVEGFNRETNMFNSQQDMQAQQLRMSQDATRLNAAMAAAQMREGIARDSANARTANLTNLFDSIGDIGRENVQRNWIRNNPGLYYTIDDKGVHYKDMTGLPMDLQASIKSAGDKEWEEKKAALEKEKAEAKENTKAYGGRIKTKKRGITI